jgi:hypothetical protein
MNAKRSLSGKSLPTLNSVTVLIPDTDVPAQKKSSMHKDTVIVFLSVMIFMVVTWFYFVHKIYINHMHDGDDPRRNVVIRLQKGGR